MREKTALDLCLIRDNIKELQERIVEVGLSPTADDIDKIYLCIDAYRQAVEAELEQR